MTMGTVLELHPRERVMQDCEPIATIYRNLGTASADQVVTRALAELAMTMAGLSDQIRGHEMEEVSRHLRKLQRMAENLGLISLGVVAGDVRVCLDRSDSTAFSAVWARLLRIAERSLRADYGAMNQTIP